MDPVSPKRPCCSSSSSSSSSSSTLSDSPPLRLSSAGDMDKILETLLGLSDLSLELTLQRLLESRRCDSDKENLIDSVLRFGGNLQESAKRFWRKRAALHNSASWPLPPDLTVKVFSALDTQSLCHAASACSMFNKCAMDPLCYADIDLTSVVPKINNAVVCTMIGRAGRHLRSLRLGILPDSTITAGTSRPLAYSISRPADTPVFSWTDKRNRQGKESCVLTRACLMSLSVANGATGALLKKLHLYNIDRMDNAALGMAILACPSLLDLEVVGLHVELRQTLESVSKNCHLIERLSFESSKTGRDDSLKSPTCFDLVNRCPNVTSLALRGFKLQDHKVRILVKEISIFFSSMLATAMVIVNRQTLDKIPKQGFRKLKYVDFSTSYSVTGVFLRNLGIGTNGYLLECLILRDCMHLKEVEVARLLSAVLSGDFKFLRHLDVSNKEGLASKEDWYERCYAPSDLPLSRVMEERPGICLLADFPSEGSFIELEHMMDSEVDIEVNSDVSLPLELSLTSDESSSFMSLSECSYHSDQGSGNDDGQNDTYALFEESSDEIDFLVT